MNIIDIARECGAAYHVNRLDRPPFCIEFTESALTALESRIRADEREKATQDAKRWREWRTGEPRTIVVTKGVKKPVTVMYGPNKESGYGEAFDEVMDAAIRNSVHSDAAPLAEPE